MPSALMDKDEAPTDASLARVLGRAKPHWDAILAHLDERDTKPVHEWKFYGAKHGWQLKLSIKKKALLYLIPNDGKFMAALALDDRAVARLDDAGLPEALVTEILAAKRAPEGRPARVEVSRKLDVASVEALLTLKLGVTTTRVAT